MLSTDLSTADQTLVYPKKEIRKQLDQILSHEMFSHSPVLSNFLKFIVEETLEGHTDELKEYTIAVNALGKSADFNPQIDAIVRIHAGRLRRLLNEYYQGPGRDNSVKIEVLKGTYIPVFRSHTVEKAKVSLNGSSRTPSKSFSRTKLTIAILPFRYLCPDNKYQFFVDGFGEELTQSFSKFQSISVIAHHSSRKYSSIDADVHRIGSELGAHYLINGSVMRTGKEVRINVGLVETMNSTQLWSKSYNYALKVDNLLKIQSEIVDHVCSVLGGYYGLIIQDGMHSAFKNTFADIESFDAVLWNYYFHMNFTREAYLKTREALEKAIVDDPDNACCLSMLSELYLDAYVLGFPTVDDPINTGYQLVQRAIKINPRCQHAYQELAWVQIYRKEKEEAIVAMETCLSLNPFSVSSIGAIGFGFACVGEYKRALPLLSKSLDLNPHCPWWFHLGFFLIYFHYQQYDQALESALKIDAPDEIFLKPLTRAIAKTELGMIKNAQPEVTALINDFPEIVSHLRLHLGFFIIDDQILDRLMAAACKAGLPIHKNPMISEELI